MLGSSNMPSAMTRRNVVADRASAATCRVIDQPDGVERLELGNGLPRSSAHEPRRARRREPKKDHVLSPRGARVTHEVPGDKHQYRENTNAEQDIGNDIPRSLRHSLS